MSHKFTAGGGAIVAVFVLVAAMFLAVPAYAGITATDRDPAMVTVSWQTQDNGTRVYSFMREGIEKLVYVEQGSEPLYSDETNFKKWFSGAMYEYAPEVSVFHMRREVEAAGVHIKLFAYDLSAMKAAESPYAAGSGMQTAFAMIQALRSVCIIDKEKCKPERK